MSKETIYELMGELKNHRSIQFTKYAYFKEFVLPEEVGKVVRTACIHGGGVDEPYLLAIKQPEKIINLLKLFGVDEPIASKMIENIPLSNRIAIVNFNIGTKKVFTGVLLRTPTATDTKEPYVFRFTQVNL